MTYVKPDLRFTADPNWYQHLCHLYLIQDHEMNHYSWAEFPGLRVTTTQDITAFTDIVGTAHALSGPFAIGQLPRPMLSHPVHY